MDRSQINEWLTVATNVAVVAGLVFLAMEVQQNNVALRSNVLQDVVGDSNSLNLAIATDADLRDTWIEGLLDPDALSESKKLQFNVVLHVWFSTAQNQYFQIQNGVLDEEIADGQWLTIATMHHAFEGFRQYWESRKYLYAPAFREYIETEVFTREPLESDGPATSDAAAVSRQLERIYEASVAKGSVAELTTRHLRFFAAQPMLLPPDQPAVVGREAVAEWYRQALSGIEIRDNSYSNLTVIVSGNLAMRRYVGTGTFRLTGQAESQVVVNDYTDVLLREDDDWRTLLHSWSPAQSRID